jgi:hypothetical protein
MMSTVQTKPFIPASFFGLKTTVAALLTGFAFSKFKKLRMPLIANILSCAFFLGLSFSITAQITITKSIATGSDDAEEAGPNATGTYSPGNIDLTSTDMELTQDDDTGGGYTGGTQKIGLRFTALNIPPGATITNAYLTFGAIAADAPNTNNGVTSLTIRAEAADNPVTFTTSSYNISNRPLTSTSVAWSPGAWTSGTAYNSPNLASIVQEIVNRPGWAGGNSMAFIITGTGSRSADSYNGNAANAPKLVVTYTTPAPGGVSGSQLWLKADFGFSAFTDGAGVATWNDASANSANATSTSNHPQFRAGNSLQAINFNPSISFNGINNYFNLPSGFNDFTQGVTAYAVMNSNFGTVVTWGRIFQLGTGNNNNNALTIYRLGTTDNLTLAEYNGSNAWLGGVETSSTPIATANGSVMLGFTNQGGTSGQTNRASAFRFNGLTQSTSTYGAVPITINRTVNRVGTGGYSADLLNGYLSELIIVNREITSTERQKLETYLALKYGITLNQTSAQNYLASNGTTIFWNATTNSTYKNNIAGIARDDASALNQKQSKSVNAGLQVAIGNGNTIAATNAANLNDFSADYSALVWGDNGASAAAWTATGAPAGRQILARTWKVQETGTVGSVKVQVPDNSSTNGLPNEGSNPVFLLVDADGNFTSGATIITMTLNGLNWEAEVDFTNGQFFTFAQGCVFSHAGTQVNVTPCAGGANGSINLTVSGGVAPYTYNWSDIGTVGNLQNRTGLAAGEYKVAVTDAASCVAGATFTITQPASIMLSASVTPAPAGSSSGAIDLTVNGGVSPHTYNWAASGGGSVPSGQAANQDLTGLVAGSYTVTVTDASSCSSTASFTVLNYVIKHLYLSDPSQALDRVHPGLVSPVDNTTASSVTLSTNLTLKDEFNSNGSYAGNDGTANWLNNWQELGESNGASTNYVSVRSNSLVLGGYSNDGQSITGRGIWRSADLSGASSATLSFNFTESSTGALIVTLSISGDNGASFSDLETFTLSTGTVSRSYDISAYATSGTVIRLLANGSIPEETTKEMFFDNIAIDYTAQSSTTFTQNPVLCSPLTIVGGQPVIVTNYVSIVSGTMPASPNITAQLKYGATTILTLTNPTFSGGLLTWTGTLPAGVTIPAGQAIALQITNGQPGVSFNINYDSQTKPSKINLPVTTYINIDSYDVYNAAYPGGSIITNAVGGNVVYPRAVVSDPFGFSDITGLNLNISPPLPGTTVAATSVATSGCTRTYQYTWTTPFSSGTMSIPATAKEGFENTVTDVQPLSFDLCTPTIGTPVFASGASSTRCQGAGNVTYSATSTSSTGIAYSLDAASLAAGNTISSVTGAVTYTAGWSGTSTITATAAGCGGPKTATHTVTVIPNVDIPVFVLGGSSTRCQGTGTLTYTATASNTTGITYSLNAASISGGNSINASTGAVTYTSGWAGTSIITASAAGCGGPKTATHTVTHTPVVTTPVFALGASSTRCQGGGSVTYSATASNSTSITYSLDAASIAAGNIINASTGVIAYTSGWSGTSVITVSAAGCGGPKTATHTVTITPNGTLTFALGATSSRASGNGNVTYSATANNGGSVTYSLDATSLAGGLTINSNNGRVNYPSSWIGTTFITASVSGCAGAQTAIHTASTNNVYKQLYLSDPSQALDRVDPVATADGTAAISQAIGEINTIQPSSGVAIWHENGLQTPQYKVFSGGTNSFGAEATSPTVGNNKSSVLMTAQSPVNQSEAFLLEITDGKLIYLHKWNGSGWTAGTFNPVDALPVKNKSVQTAAITYSSGGSAMLVWDNDAADNLVHYRTWNGSNWSTEQTFNITTGANNKPVNHMQLAAHPTSNEMVLVFTDDGDGDDYVYVWNGSSWGNGLELTIDGSNTPYDANVVYERNSGHALVVFGKADNDAIYFRTWNGSSWSAEQVKTYPAGASTNAKLGPVSLAASPNSDVILMGLTTEAGEGIFMTWNGSSFSTASQDNRIVTALDKPKNISPIDIAFESQSGQALAVAQSTGGNTVTYFTWTPGSGFSSALTVGDFIKKPRLVSLSADPNSDKIMLSVNAEKLGKTLLWNGSSWNSIIGHEADMGLNGDEGAGNGIPISYFWLPVGNIVFTPTTSFTMAPALCSDLMIKGNQTITVTTFTNILSGSLTNGQTYNFDAVLKYGGANIITLNPATYSSASGGSLTWTGSLPSDVTVPAGQAISLDITMTANIPGFSFALMYDSQTKPSKINLPVSTFIDITSHAVYSAAYPGGSVITSAVNGTTVYTRTVVTDPFGFSDITGLTMNISPTVGNVTATSVATAGCTRTYQYTWNPTGLGGTYSLPATAMEGYEDAVTDLQALNFDICSPTIGTPVFALGATSTRCQGAGTVTYTATSTNSTGMAYSLDAASATSGNTINTATGDVTYLTGWTGTTVITATASGCGGPKISTHTVTTTPYVGTPVFSLGGNSIRCQGSGTVTYSATASNSTGITYSLDAASISGGNSINASTGAVTYSAGWSGTTVITASAAGCSGPKTATHTVTVSPGAGTPVFALGASSTRCGITGTYTATAANATSISYSLDATSLANGNSINPSNGVVAFSSTWAGTSIVTATATGCGSTTSATHTITISPNCPPVANDDAANGAGGAPIPINVLGNDTDPNNNINPNSITILTQPVNGSALLSNGMVVYLPNGTFEGVDQFTYQVCDFSSPTPLCSSATVIVTIDPTTVDACSEAVKRQVYYMPYPEQDARLALIASTGSSWLPIPSNNIRTIISIKVPYPGMKLVYDHWEDGYEADADNPVQSTTQIWGDGNPYNGIAPGYSDDILPSGAAIVLDNTMPANPRVASSIFYDGKDKLVSSGAITVTQVTGEPSIIFVQCMKTNVTNSANFGKSFTIPVGQDFNSQDFAYAALFIRASENNTTLNIDKDNNGTFETTTTINEGQSYFVNGGVLSGAVITSSAPIGVDLHFGGIDGYSSREVPIFPATWYSDTYYTPVPTTQSPDSCAVLLYNSLNRSININWAFGSSSSGTISLPAKTVKRFPLSISSNDAYKFVNPTGESFTAIEIVDSYTPGGGGNSGSTYDWAFNLISESRLTSFAAIAWAPGSVNGTANGNPVWVTPSANTTVYVKYDGEVLNGGSVSPCGLRYDVSYSLDALSYKKLLDASDKDQGGLAVYTCDGTKIAAVYGEDPSLSTPASPYWDVGSTIQPFCGQKLIFANDDRAYTLTNQPVTVPILKNDWGFLSVIDPNTLSTLGYRQPKNGTVSVNSNGTILYTPNLDFVGSDTLEYGICSTPGSPPNVVCDRAYVIIQINACPTPANANLISGQIFLDKNKDGIKNEDGTDVPGKVYLYADGNCNGVINTGELVDSVTVDNSGYYQFLRYPEKLVSDDFDGSGGTSSCASGSDGSAAWATNWVDAGDLSVGYCVFPALTEANTDVEIKQDGAFGYALRLDDVNKSATRTVNLSGATYTFLSFSYRRANNNLTSGESIHVQVSTNGSTFTTIYSINGDGSSDAGYVRIHNQNISSFAAATTYIRFLTNANVDEGDFVFIDNVEIKYLKYPQCYITKIDPTLIPADHALTTVGQYSMTASNGGTCLAPYNFGIAKNSTSISGTLYNDANGLSDGSVNGTAFGSPSGAPVYVYLIDATGKIRFKVTANSSNGTFTFPQADVNSNFTLMASTSDLALYSVAPSAAVFPPGWASAGEAFGTNNAAGTGNEAGTPNSIIAVNTGTSAVTNVRIGIQQVNAGPDKVACKSGSATMAATTSPGTWSPLPGNPGTATITSPTSPTTTINNFSAAGNFYFLWTNNGVSDTALVTVSLDLAFTANAEGFSECVGGSLAVSVSVTGGIAPISYQWQSSTNNVTFTNISGATQPNYTPPSTTAGTTYYRVIVTPTGGGCGSLTSAVATVVILADPAITAPPANITECIGAAQAFSVSVSGGLPPLTYQWQSSPNNLTFTNVAGANASTYTPPATTAGTTYYKVVVGSAGNGCNNATSSAATLTVNGLPVASLGADTTICVGTSATLVANANNGAAPYSYSWNNGLGNGSSKVVAPSSTTVYMVTITDNNGCSATTQKQVNIGLCPEVCDNGIDDDGDGLMDCADPDCEAPIINNVNATNATNCPLMNNGQITINATGPNLVYSIDGALTFQSSNVFSGLTAGNYYVRIRNSVSGCYMDYVGNPVVITGTTCIEICNNGTDDDGDGLADCLDSDCKPNADAGSNVNICYGTSYTLSASAMGGNTPYSYTWDNGLGAGQSKSVSPLATTTYRVTVTSATGCTSTDSVTVTVTPCPENCTDGIDNDADGLVDCADPDCQLVGQPHLANDVYQTCPGAVFKEQPIFNDNNLQNPVYSIYANPIKGSVSINYQGIFTYNPLANAQCGVDSFKYQVCNSVTGCCDQATVILNIGDVNPPVLQNVPADVTINCGEPIPVAPIVFGVDNCPGIYVSFNEVNNQGNSGTCQNYTIVRTWTATDICGNAATGSQTITVQDIDAPELFRVYTLSNGKKLVAGLTTKGRTSWQHIKFPVSFGSTPIVFSQVVSNNSPEAIITRHRNIDLEGFDLSLQEEENGDGVHAFEKVAWMAMEPGNLTDASKLQSGIITNVNNTVKTMNYSSAYTGLPMLIASPQTYVESDPVQVRFSSQTSSAFSLFLEEEKSKDAEVAHANEVVAYLAAKTGTIADKNDDFVAMAGAVTLNQNWTTVTLGRKFTKPVVLFGGQPSGNDPATIRVRNVTSTSFEVKIQEWGYLDGVVPLRTISYFIVEGSVPAAIDNVCSGSPTQMIPGFNLFAVDNCDNQVAIDFTESSQMTPNGLILNKLWTASDDCGNTTNLVHNDTCKIAAVMLRANLNGAMIGTPANTTLMRDNLRAKGYIPTNNPYPIAGNAGGAQSTDALLPSLLDATGDNAIVDWILVQARSATTPSTVIKSVPCLLQRDGDIVTKNGSDIIVFEGIPEGNYYIYIKHRNHIGMISGNPVYLKLGTIPAIDFGNVGVHIYNSGTAGRISNGKMMMWAGDLNNDNKVIYQGPLNDVFLLFSEVMTAPGNSDNLANFIFSGYHNTDINLDGFSIYQGPSNDRSMLLLNTVLSHPSNNVLLANFIAQMAMP